MLLAGVLATPALAQDHAAPIISYPTSPDGEAGDSGTGLLAIMQILHAMRAQLRSLENQAEITNHKIELLRSQQQSFLADIDRQLRRLRRKQGVETPSPAFVPSAPGSTSSVPPSTAAQPPAAATVPPGAPATPPAGGANVPPGGASAPAAQPPASPPGAASPAANPNVTIVPPDTTGTGTPATPAAPQASGAQALYAQAFDALRAGHYRHAVAGFQKFLARYPRDRRDSEAQYWIAETQYIERNYKAAKISFRTLVYAYPQSKRVPNAWLKIGYMAKWQGHPDKARTIWQNLMQRYPMSAAAQVARSALANLSPPGASPAP